MFLPQDVIRKKRDREELTADEIREFVTGVVAGSVNQGQIGAFTMATYLNGMSGPEHGLLGGRYQPGRPCRRAGERTIASLRAPRQERGTVGTSRDGHKARIYGRHPPR